MSVLYLSNSGAASPSETVVLTSVKEEDVIVMPVREFSLELHHGQSSQPQDLTRFSGSDRSERLMHIPRFPVCCVVTFSCCIHMSFHIVFRLNEAVFETLYRALSFSLSSSPCVGFSGTSDPPP